GFSIWPSSAITSPAITFISVDLPAPLRPTRHRRSPLSMDRVTPSSSGAAPKESWMLRRVRIGMSGLYGEGGAHGSAKVSVVRRRQATQQHHQQAEVTVIAMGERFMGPLMQVFIVANVE